MRKAPFSFVCKFCTQPVTITDDDHVIEEVENGGKRMFGAFNFYTELIYCPNPDCRNIHIYLNIERRIYTGSKEMGGITFPGKTTINEEVIQVHPESDSLILPSYIPKDIKRDLEEANLIKNKSIRASASLLRRALQSMLRDFWKDKLTPDKEITNEIKQLQNLIDVPLYQALHSVKNIAKFANHPEKDVSEIVEVTKEDLDLMFKVIFICIKEWYVNREQRLTSLKDINKSSTRKSEKKSSTKTPPVV